MRHELQVGPVDHLGQLHQPHEIHRPVHAITIAVVQLALVEQAPDHVRRRFRRHFQPHRIAQMPRRQFTLQRDAQVGDFVFIDEQFAVARDAKLVATAHHQMRKQRVDKTLHQRAQQHEAVRIARQRFGHAHEPRQRARRLHDAHHRLAAERVLAFQLDDEVQALVQHARKRMRGIEADRRQHRQQLVLKIIARPVGLRFAPRFHAVKVDAFAFERGKHGVLKHHVLLMDQPMRALDHEVVHMLQRHAVG